MDDSETHPEGSRAETIAALLHSGRRIPLDSAGVTIGRGDDNDIVIVSERVSRRHARITVDHTGRFAVEDLGSQHGTLVNDKPLEGSHGLQSGDAISIDDELLRFVAGAETRVASGELTLLETHAVKLVGDRVTVGRDPSNQVVLPDPNVSRFHAELVARAGGWEVVDLGSQNGTRVGGEPV